MEGFSDLTIRIDSEDDLHNRFDPSRSRLSDEAIDYLLSDPSAFMTPRPVRLTVISPEPINEENARSAVDSTIDFYIKGLGREKRNNTIAQIRLFIIGITFISVWLTAATFLTGVWPEVLSIIGSFAVWEASNIWIKENPQINMRRKMLTSLKDAEIVFKHD